jgi:hypothetical protein
MEWANNKIALRKKVEPLRLILAVTDKSDPKISQYLKTKGYETGRHIIGLSEAKSAIQFLLLFFGLLGVAFLVLSMIIIIVSFQLVISRSMEDIRLLIDLGYKKRKLLGSFQKVLIPLLSITGGAGLILSLIIIFSIHFLLKKFGILLSPSLNLGILFLPLLIIISMIFVIRFIIGKSISQKNQN